MRQNPQEKNPQSTAFTEPPPKVPVIITVQMKN
jgi:hypothetical protein